MVDLLYPHGVAIRNLLLKGSMLMDAQVDQFGDRTRPARFIAVGNHISLKAAISEELFSAELERVFSLAVPHLSKERPNLVALGEVLGLPLALVGKRGYL